MYRKEQHISKDGEILSTKVTHYAERFDDVKGYFLYSNVQSINGKAEVFFPEALTKLDIANLAILSRYLIGNTNMLGYRGNNGVKPMNVEQMADILAVNKRRNYAFLQKMMKEGMIAKVTVEINKTVDVQYYMNPIYFMNGRNLSLNLYMLFQHFIDEYIPDWAINRFRELHSLQEKENKNRKG